MTMRARLLALLVGMLLVGTTACDASSPGESREVSTPPPTVPPGSEAPADAVASSGPRPAPPVGPVTEQEVAAWLGRLPPDRMVGSEASGRLLAELEAALADWGFAPIRTEVPWTLTTPATPSNLEVRVAPADGRPGGPFLVVCAHHDGVPYSPAADDNGSGVVALAVLARRLGADPPPVEVRLVWFDAEEVGLLGALAWVSALTEDERSRCLGAVNLESIGYADERPGSQDWPPGAGLLLDEPRDTGDFLLVVGNQASAALAEAVTRGLSTSIPVQASALLPGQGWLLPDSRRSDHSRFWDAGLPAVMVTDTANFRNPHYHRPTDTVDTLDVPFLTRAIRGLEVGIRMVAD